MQLKFVFFISVFLCSGHVLAVDYLKDKAEVESLLSGKRLDGTYLRTQSAYSLAFYKDGRLKNQRGEVGRWWVNKKGQYCREWQTGRLQGHQACLDLLIETSANAKDKNTSQTLVIYSNGKRAALGRLRPIVHESLPQ